jgi:hypothetical protein
MPPMVSRGIFTDFVISIVNYGGFMWFLIFLPKSQLGNVTYCQIWHTELKWIPVLKFFWELVKTYYVWSCIHILCGTYMCILWIIVAFLKTFSVRWIFERNPKMYLDP